METGLKPYETHVRGIRGAPASFRQETVMSIPYRDRSVDAVVTDSPYYDMIEYADTSDLFHVWLKRVLPGFEPDLFGPEAVRTKDGLQNKNKRDHGPPGYTSQGGERRLPRWSRARRTSAVPFSRRSADPTPAKSSTATAKPLPSPRSMPGSGIPGQNRATCSGQGQSAVARPARSAGL